MKKHGASHGAATLVCTLAAALLTDVVRKHVPVVYNFFDQLSSFVVKTLNLGYESKLLTIVIYATILAVIWGIFFALTQRD